MDTEINELYNLMAELNLNTNDLNDQIIKINFILSLNSEYLKEINKEYAIIIIKLLNNHGNKN